MISVSDHPPLRIVDAQAGGDITRVILGGVPELQGVTVKEQCADFVRRFDGLRLKLIQPPHGALHMCPVLLLPPRVEEVDFGVIIMESMGYPPISGSNLFCATAVALEYGFAPMLEPETHLRVETPAGLVAISAQCRNGRCRRVEFENMPAHIESSIYASIEPGADPMPIAVISAGVAYAAVDADRLRVPLRPGCGEALLALGVRLTSIANTEFVLFHGPVNTGPEGLDCTIAVFQNPGVICRGPTGTGTSAMLALAYSRGVISTGQKLTTRSPGGSAFLGRILSVRDSPTGPVLRTVVSGDVSIGREIDIV